jgi:hypothetical protein
MTVWNQEFERQCCASIDSLLDAPQNSAEQIAAWQALIGKLIPRLDAWTNSGRYLRCLPVSDRESHASEVLFRILRQLQNDNYKNLATFRARTKLAAIAAPDAEYDDAETEAESDTVFGDVAEAMVADVKEYSPEEDEDENNGGNAASQNDDRKNTPFRGWIVLQLRQQTYRLVTELLREQRRTVLVDAPRDRLSDPLRPHRTSPFSALYREELDRMLAGVFDRAWQSLEEQKRDLILIAVRFDGQALASGEKRHAKNAKYAAIAEAYGKTEQESKELLRNARAAFKRAAQKAKKEMFAHV